MDTFLHDQRDIPEILSFVLTKTKNKVIPWDWSHTPTLWAITPTLPRVTISTCPILCIQPTTTPWSWLLQIHQGFALLISNSTILRQLAAKFSAQISIWRSTFFSSDTVHSDNNTNNKGDQPCESGAMMNVKGMLLVILAVFLIARFRALLYFFRF